MKTVSARIRGATTELEEMGEETDGLADGLSKYNDEIVALTGVSILEEGTVNEYKSLYDIFYELSQIWDTLSETAQSRVSEILGGTRQLSVISSLLNNFSDAEGALTDALGSSGTALSANATYMDTIEAKTSQFSATVQELANDAINSDLIKSIVDFGTVAVQTLDNIIENFGTLSVLLGAGGVAAGIKSLV